MRKKNQSGQALLVVLLSLSVVLIIVLYIVSRSVTDISITGKDEEALRAFSAAEAGIERALVIGDSSGSLANANFTASVSDFAKGDTSVVYPIGLKAGNVATFWLSRPSETGFAGNEIKVCWGESGTNASSSTTPAIEATVVYTSTPNDFTTLLVARGAYDPNSSRYVTNSFSLASGTSCTIGDEEFQFQTTINLSSLGILNATTPDVLQFLKIRMLYNDTEPHKVGIDISSNASEVLPSQGKVVDSAGSYGDSNRRIEVYQLHPVAPAIFDSAVFSSSGITK